MLEECERSWLALGFQAVDLLLDPMKDRERVLGREDIYGMIDSAISVLDSTVWRMLDTWHSHIPFPAELVEDVTHILGHVFRDDVPPVRMWCGIPIGVHAPERKPFSGTTEVHPDS